MKLIPANKISHWLKIYKLYCQAFPKYERKPFSIIISMKKKGKTDVWYLEENNEFVGLAITINDDDKILLDYFAIAANKRNTGLGSKLLRQLQTHYAPKGLFIEIESTYTDAPNLDERKSRKEFYLRNNMVPMNVMVKLFGVEMELLGYNCMLDFAGYYSFYLKNYGDYAAKNIEEARFPS